MATDARRLISLRNYLKDVKEGLATDGLEGGEE